MAEQFRSGQIVRRRDPHTTFSLHRLYDECRVSLQGELPFQRIDIAEWDGVRAMQHLPEAFPQGGLAHQ